MISNHHRTIFIHIPDCVDRSVETAFLQDLGLDWEDSRKFTLGSNANAEAGPPELAYLTGQDYVACGHLTDLQFLDFYKFAIVRDPVERIISTYNSLNLPLDLHAFIQDWLVAQFSHADQSPQQQAAEESLFYRIRPQVDFVTGKAGDILVDDIFRFETLASDFEKFRTRCHLSTKLEDLPEPHEGDASRSNLSVADLSVIRELYALDFSAFGYSAKE